MIRKIDMADQRRMMWAIRALSLAGLALFAALFIATIAAPDRIETAARGFIATDIRAELERSVVGRLGIGATPDSELLRDGIAARAAQASEDLRRGVAERIALIVTQFCRYDCRTQTVLAGRIEVNLERRLDAMGIGLKKLESIGQGRYSAMLEKALRDLRIFSGSNALIFGTIFALSFAQGIVGRALLAPFVPVLAATLGMVALYVSDPNRFFALLFGQFTGYGYLGFAAVIALMLLGAEISRERALQPAVDTVKSA